jgi:hypothetical protein
MGKPAETDRHCLPSLSHSFTLDSNIYVKSARAGYRVRARGTRFVARRRKLTVHATKSAGDRPGRRTFRGFPFSGRRPHRRQVSEKALKAFTQEVRQHTSRRRRGHSSVSCRSCDSTARGGTRTVALPKPRRGARSWPPGGGDASAAIGDSTGEGADTGSCGSAG